jgi:hypothetical protein
VLQTANFQTNPEEELSLLKKFQPDKPGMVMEYWSGWFDHWFEQQHHTRTVEGSIILHKACIVQFSSEFCIFPSPVQNCKGYDMKL